MFIEYLKVLRILQRRYKFRKFNENLIYLAEKSKNVKKILKIIIARS